MNEVAQAIEGACPGAVVEAAEGAGEQTVEIVPERVAEVARWLKEGPLAFTLLSGITCADFPEDERRLRVAYHLFSLASGHRARLRVRTGVDGPDLPTVTGVWSTADWHEREVYDMFGVRFAGHPDLARILMPLDWEGHPLRRDYPLGGEEVVFTDER